jgi:hypothetical protein
VCVGLVVRVSQFEPSCDFVLAHHESPSLVSLALLDIRDQCAAAKIPFHFLQQGGSKPCHDGCLSKYGCRRLYGKWYQQYPVPTLVSEGAKIGKRQRERVLCILAKQKIPVYKTPVQRESTRGSPGLVDRILLVNSIDQATLENLRAELPQIKLTLETW